MDEQRVLADIAQYGAERDEHYMKTQGRVAKIVAERPNLRGCKEKEKGHESNPRFIPRRRLASVFIRDGCVTVSDQPGENVGDGQDAGIG